MNKGTEDLPQDVIRMIKEENNLMWIFIALFVAFVLGLVTGYFVFTQNPWHP